MTPTQTCQMLMDIGDEVEMDGVTWKRVAEVPEDDRPSRLPSMTMRSFSVTDSTTEGDIHDELLPVSIPFMLEVVQFRAIEANDKRKYTEDHIRGFLVCLYGGAQFKEGSDCWATDTVDMLPPPNFGRHLNADRFDRILRYFARGPEGCDENAAEDPWFQVRWMVNGYNACRKRVFIWGWCCIVDESMVSWTGKSGVGGLPHLSFIPRKPEPLGVELKTMCDGTSGVCMHMEVQEGKLRMTRKKYHQQYGATTSCTLRLCEGAGLHEKNKADNQRLHRGIGGDSWFASRKTAVALEEELGLRFVGPVKTNTKSFPVQQMRHTLHNTPRGTSITLQEVGSNRYAIGWNDHWYKTYITNYGVTLPGEAAQKKRQRHDTGRNYFIPIARPQQLQHYYKIAPLVDRHNMYRQHMSEPQIKGMKNAASGTFGYLSCIGSSGFHPRGAQSPRGPGPAIGC